MKSFFKLSFLLICILSLSLTSKTNQSITGTWNLVSITDLNTNEQHWESENLNYPIRLQFTDNGQLGKISGHTTSNNVFGQYELFEQNKMKVNQFGGTKVGEQGWGKGFWTTIRQSSSYELKSETLIIYAEDATEIMRFSRVAEK
jgi:heat shock protein HslJ